MKKVITGIIIILILTASGCYNVTAYELSQPSLIVKYFQGPYQWGGIVLGESTIEESLLALEQIPEVVAGTADLSPRFRNFDEAICLDFNPGYRESALCIWIDEGKAEVLEFFSADLLLSEIQDNLGSIEEVSVVRIHDINSTYIQCYGKSFTSGLYIWGRLDQTNKVDEIKEVTLTPNTVFDVNLTSVAGMDLLLEAGTYNVVYNYLQDENKFEEWYGYGTYTVQIPDIRR